MGQRHASAPAPPPSPVLHVDTIRGSFTSLSIVGRYHVGHSLEQDYCLERKVLGTGVNGPVRLASRGSRKYAVKSFRRVGMNEAERQALRNEVEVFLHLDHPHVATLEDVYETSEDLHLVMEYMSGGELYDRLSERVRYSEVDAARTARQMLLAVAYLHTHGVVHRDLKLENFLYERKDEEHLKLIDFGFAKFWDNSLAAMSRPCGTVHYVAPEVLAQSYTEKCDMWSLGIIVYVLLMGSPPFHGGSKDVLRQVAGGRLTIRRSFGQLSDDARDFVLGLLATDPRRRPSAAEALQHPWTLASEQSPSPSIDVAVLQSIRRFAQASHFRRACFSMMAWSLTLEDRRQLQEQFQAIDVDCSGTIGLAEFAKVLKSNFSIDSREAELLFKGLDADGDHEICYREFLAASLQCRVRLHEDVLRATFQRFDVNRTGKITADSLRSLLGDSFEGCDVEALLREADTSGTGAIEYSDFLAYLQEEDEAQPEEAEQDEGITRRTKSMTSETMADLAGCLVDKALASPAQPRPLPSPMAARKKLLPPPVDLQTVVSQESSSAPASSRNPDSARSPADGGQQRCSQLVVQPVPCPDGKAGARSGRRRPRWMQCFCRDLWAER